MQASFQQEQNKIRSDLMNEINTAQDELFEKSKEVNEIQLKIINVEEGKRIALDELKNTYEGILNTKDEINEKLDNEITKKQKMIEK